MPAYLCQRKQLQRFENTLPGYVTTSTSYVLVLLVLEQFELAFPVCQLTPSCDDDIVAR